VPARRSACFGRSAETRYGTQAWQSRFLMRLLRRVAPRNDNLLIAFVLIEDNEEVWR